MKDTFATKTFATQAFASGHWTGVVIYVGASPCRLVNVDAETRIITVDAENRIVEVECP